VEEIVAWNVRTNPLPLLLVLSVSTPDIAVPANHKVQERATTIVSAPGPLWREPRDIASRNLYYGSGGASNQPVAPFRFDKEDLEGSNPKFTVTDQNGSKWKVKLGQEARPETAASRLIWAVGYFTDEYYLVRNLKVEGLPMNLKRGRKLVGADGSIALGRFKKEPDGAKKAGIWPWQDEGWQGSREWNGLRAMMAVINNWDLKDVNNAVYDKDSGSIFMVSDLGATFGSPGRSWPAKKAKDNLQQYAKSRFIRSVHGDMVDFETPARPRFVYFVGPKEYMARVHLEALRCNVPREDAEWVGQWLGHLSPQQIRDAFRAAGYSSDEVEGFAQVVEKRIAQLRAL
jgi:hypothetical protein